MGLFILCLLEAISRHYGNEYVGEREPHIEDILKACLTN